MESKSNFLGLENDKFITHTTFKKIAVVATYKPIQYISHYP